MSNLWASPPESTFGRDFLDRAFWNISLAVVFIPASLCVFCLTRLSGMFVYRCGCIMSKNGFSKQLQGCNLFSLVNLVKMSADAFYKNLVKKLGTAWVENEKKLDAESDPASREFLYGYRLAINELTGWVESESI